MWTKIDEEVEIIETDRTSVSVDEIDVWQVDRRVPVPQKSPARTTAAVVHPLPVALPRQQHHQYSTSLEGLHRMGSMQSKSNKPKKSTKYVRKISESVPNLEEIPVAINHTMPPRLSLDHKVLNEINADSENLYRNCEHSSSIELNSILHRDSGFFINKCSDEKSAFSLEGPTTAQLNSDRWYTPKNKLDGFEMKVSNPIWVKKKNNIDSEPSAKRFYNRFSKSIQNLFNLNSSVVGIGREECSPASARNGGRKSVSEVNLLRGGRKGRKVSDSNTVLGAAYCPSSWFTMKTNLKRNATMDSPKGPFGRVWRKYKSMGLFKKRNQRQNNSKR